MTAPAKNHLHSRQNVLKTMRSGRPIILPSMLLCDFGNLAREIELLEEAGVEALHMDVMDGVFVPNFTYGMSIIEAVRRLTSLPIDVHLMIQDPAKYAQAFIDAGADLITFHIEAVENPTDLLRSIHASDIAAGLAINPNTPFERLKPHVSDCDLVLVMSVEAGFGGQTFNPIALERLASLRKEMGADFLLEVDGGVNNETISACRQAGADLMVVGSAIFKQPDYCQAITQLHQSMPEAN